MKDLMNQVAKLIAQGATLEETKRNVNFSQYESKMFSFRNYVAGNIEKAYSVIGLEQYNHRLLGPYLPEAEKGPTYTPRHCDRLRRSG